MQEESGGRLFPMAIIPWWDVDLAVAEIERIARLGLRGLNTTTAPHDHGLPDLGSEHWNPMWEAAAANDLPINFHIGASDSSLSWFGSVPWPSLNGDQKLGLGSAMMYLNNAGVIGNIIYSGVLERYPTLQFVSVESGVGWIPFFLKALDYQVGEMTPGSMDNLSMAPSDYFRRQIHSCFWFERSGIAEAIESVLSQTFQDFELIVVDDGSKDDSLAKIERRAALDPRVQPYALVRNFGSQSASCAGFDLAQGPLWRVRLMRLGAAEHWLSLTLHHIVTDGWSMGVLVRELSQLYAAFTRGEASPLPALPVQYADAALEGVDDDTIAGIMGLNAARLYDIPLPA